MYKSIADVQRAFPDFFSPAVMHGFRSKIESSLWTSNSGRQFFITSEQVRYIDASGRASFGKRKHTVREVLNNDIVNYGQFAESTPKQARSLLAVAMKEGKV